MKYIQMYKNIPIDKAWTNTEDREYFIRQISNLTFGANTIERGYSMEEVIEKLREFSDNALKWEEGEK